MNQHLKTAVVKSRQRARQLYTSASPVIASNYYSPYVLFDFSHSPRPSPRKLPYQQPGQHSQSEHSPGSPATTLTSSYVPAPFAAHTPWVANSTPAYALPPPLWLCPPLDAAWFPLALGIDVGPGPWDVIRVSAKEKQPVPEPPVEKEVPWSFECGAFGIPKGKAKRKSVGTDEDLGLSVQVGEDSYFVRPDALGVADGVGGWAHHAHADSARFARMLMHNCASEFVTPSSSSSSQPTPEPSSSKHAAAAYPTPPETPRKPTESSSLHPTQLADALTSMSISNESIPVSPLDALHAAYERTVATFRATGTAGSSTALVAVLRDGELSVAHLGDCMLAVVRDGKFVVRSEEMQHSFNFPYQLGPHSSTTPRTDAQVLTERVVPGDIVILASDGLGDNLWDEEVLRVVERFARPDGESDRKGAVGDAGSERKGDAGVDRKGDAGLDRKGDGAAAAQPGGPIGETQQIAQALARRAKEAARGSADVPFGVRARAAGIQFMGGKTDDISVVVAVVRGPASASASNSPSTS
ncbi:protein phosphatase 2C [Ceratobasidium sp. AG-Ba]|nr:protein phosphatase 2C [Ceratobasidium sp. AG-Ba]